MKHLAPPTNEAVASLPLHHGRAELLEEIMSTTLDQKADTAAARPTRPSRRPRWMVPLAAAAAVAALVGTPLALGIGDDDDGSAAPDGGRSAAEQPAPAVGRVILDAPGWRVARIDAADQGGGVAYANGERDLEITGYPAASYDDYVEDREHIVEPPAPGRPMQVMGRAGQLWSYSRDDHTVIREVEDGRWIEIRGSGMNLVRYRDLLAGLRQVDQEEFESTLPAEFVTAGERDEVVAGVVAGIRDALAPHPLLPDGADTVGSDANDPRLLRIDVAGTVACAWLQEYSEARQAGQGGRAQAAADAMRTSRDWPALIELDEDGDYPEVVWQLADDAAAGAPADNLEGALGC